MSGSGGFDTSQVTVLTSATQIVPRRIGRVAVTIINLGTTAVDLGDDAAVTSGTGALLAGIVGASVTIPTQAEVWGIAGSSQGVSVIETY